MKYTALTFPPVSLGRAPDDQPLLLKQWLPSRLSVLANTVSLYLHAFYAERFGLSVTGWRIIAYLGERAPLCAKDLAELAAMDQVSITRATAQLAKLGYLRRRTDPTDRRRVLLQLSKRGLDVYFEVIPIANRLEQELLRDLTKSEVSLLDAMLQRIEARAASIPLTQPEAASVE